MSALEIRIVVYAVIGVLFGGSCAWGAYTLTAHHYERIAAEKQLATDAALEEAQRNVIVAQLAQKAAENAAEKNHALMVKADTAARATVLGSVHNLEAALHLGAVSSTVGHPCAPGGAGAGPGCTDGLAELVGRVNQNVEKYIAACQHDGSELTAVLQLRPPAPGGIK